MIRPKDEIYYGAASNQLKHANTSMWHNEQNGTHLSGDRRVGKSSVRILIRSQQCANLSFTQYLPLAERISKAKICAYATFLTSTHGKAALGNGSIPAFTS